MKFTVDLKFKIGDKVWLMHNGKPYEDTIDIFDDYNKWCLEQR